MMARRKVFQMNKIVMKRKTVRMLFMLTLMTITMMMFPLSVMAKAVVNVVEETDRYSTVYQNDPADEPIHDDYELVAYSKIKVDFEYIVGLLRDFVESLDAPDDEIDEEEFREKIKTLRETIDEFAGDNAKLAALLRQIVDEIEQDKKRFMGQDISVIA